MASSERVSITVLLDELVQTAGLPAVKTRRPLHGRGFDNEVHLVQLVDGRQVVLRRRKLRGKPEAIRARFLAAHGVPAPSLLASTGEATLHDFIPGALLGDLIETERDTPDIWRRVGHALRRVHDIRFPSALVGELQPDHLLLRPIDPVAVLHERLDASIPRLRQVVPTTLAYLPELHAIVDRAAPALHTAPVSLLHGDISMWNIIVNDTEAVLIDWDGPRIGESAMEVALLDKHASLFNGRGMDHAFFDGYGREPAEPNTSLHRVVQTILWAASDDWTAFAELPAEAYERTQRWLKLLLAYIAQLPIHIQRLHSLM